MGRTIPSFRIAAEIERRRWRPFRLMLNRKDRKLFDYMLNLPRFYNTACMMAARPVVFHPVMMSIIFHHYKQLQKMVTEIKTPVADNIRKCERCPKGVLQPTRNPKVATCDICGWVKIEMTTADYEEMIRKLKNDAPTDIKSETLFRFA